MKTILETEIEFPEVTYFNPNTNESRTVSYIDVPFWNEDQIETHMMRISRDEFDRYLEQGTNWLDFFDHATFYNVENRDHLRKALFEYIRNEYFNKRHITEIIDDLKRANNTIQGQYFQIENQKNEIKRLELEVMKWKSLAVTENKVVTMQSAINTMYDGGLGCRIKEVKKTA